MKDNRMKHESGEGEVFISLGQAAELLEKVSDDFLGYGDDQYALGIRAAAQLLRDTDKLGKWKVENGKLKMENEEPEIAGECGEAANNYECIKDMSLEEMAEFLAREIPHGDCFGCDLCRYSERHPEEYERLDEWYCRICHEAWLEWLKLEAVTDDGKLKFES